MPSLKETETKPASIEVGQRFKLPVAAFQAVNKEANLIGLMSRIIEMGDDMVKFEIVTMPNSPYQKPDQQ